MDDTPWPPFTDAEYHAYLAGLVGLLVWWFLPWIAMCGLVGAIAAPVYGLPFFAGLSAITALLGLVVSGAGTALSVPAGVRGILADDPRRFTRSVLLIALGLLNAAVVVGFSLLALGVIIGLGVP
jgi:hypothetical protein